jgi:hypothetical protein
MGHTATWTNIDHNLGDEPITGIAYDSKTGNLFVSTDFAVNVLTPSSTMWVPAANGLPPVATLRADARLREPGALRSDARPQCL